MRRVAGGVAPVTREQDGRAVAACLLFDGWSLPGLLMTPVAIYRNLAEIHARRVRSGPSSHLLEWAAFDLATRVGDPMRQVASLGATSGAVE